MNSILENSAPFIQQYTYWTLVGQWIFIIEPGRISFCAALGKKPEPEAAFCRLWLSLPIEINGSAIRYCATAR
jgi:hypothetical protein